MYYIAPLKLRGNGGMIVWRHAETIKNFKATEGIEYVVAKSKKETQSSSKLLPIYIGINNKLINTKRHETNWLEEFFGTEV
jgi:hypothetical protein